MRLQPRRLTPFRRTAVSAFAATELGVEFPASFAQWEQTQVDPDTGGVIGL